MDIWWFICCLRMQLIIIIIRRIWSLRIKILLSYYFITYILRNEWNTIQQNLKDRWLQNIYCLWLWNLFIRRKSRDNSFLNQWSLGMSLIFGHSFFELELECANIICSWAGLMFKCLMMSACHVSCNQNTTCTKNLLTSTDDLDVKLQWCIRLHVIE